MEKPGFKLLGIKSPVKAWLETVKTTKKTQLYPCLCEAISPVLFWNRLFGILPVVALKTHSHVCRCRFEVSKGWMIYAYILQTIYIPFVITTAGLRLSCGPDSSSGSEWYVMTCGYFISDLDSSITLITGVAYAKDVCKILEKITTIGGPIGALRRLRKTIQIGMIFILGSFTTVFLSFTYVAWLRAASLSIWDFDCHTLDNPFGVMIRGWTLVFPGVHISLVMVLCLLISTKFQSLGEQTILTLEANIKTINPDSEVATSVEENIPSATNQGLNQLAEAHRKATSCLNQINKCMGLQILAEVAANIYTIVYYLYRYSTASNKTITSNYRERCHYIIALSYRIAKLLTYLVLGHAVSTNSNKPLEALQRARIINLPTRLQQQVQSLILQWSGKKMALSAFGVVSVGPWLVAPIVGNIITYLLVALQFERDTTGNILSPNVTAILESIF